MRLTIIGAGNAGLAAAVTAGELGIQATLIEKSQRLGGQLRWSYGHFSAAGTNRQRRRGIDDTPEEHFADVMAMAHGRGNGPLIDLATREAAGMVDWLEGLGFPFHEDSPTLVSGHELYGKPRTYWGGPDARSGGLAILDTLLAELERHRDVDVRLGTRVEGLVVEGREVVGVRLEACDEVVGADRVILATGGYAANRTLVAELQPHHADALTGCLPHATGDGLQMLRDQGVEIVATDTYAPTMGMIPDPDRPGFGLSIREARLVVNANERTPAEIWVDRSGERFVNEATSSPFERERALLDRPGLSMFSIWDQSAFVRSEPVIGPGWSRDEMVGQASRDTWLKRRESLEGLAGALGIDPGGLRQSVSRWNSGDRPFGRDAADAELSEPPFWGVESTGGMLLSRGGPRVDEDLQPVRTDGTSLERVHCIGELLGMGQFSGDNFAGGMSVGPALTLGRWVVRRLADL